MSRHLALQGASDDDASRLRDLLAQAESSLDSAWTIEAESDADLLVIDIDTVYGHMDWLRAHSSGRPVAVLTEHTQFEDADLILHKPLALGNVIDVLQRVAAQIPERAHPVRREPVTPVVRMPAAPAPVAAAPSTPAPAPVAAPPAPPVPRERRLADWAQDGALDVAVRLVADGSPELVLDPSTKSYFVEGTLRSLAPYCARTITREDWQPVSAADLSRLRESGKGQPFVRLVWLSHALGSNGQLAAGLDMNGKFKLARWPQIEREFPKHFRIATVMMKQAATLTEIADQSGASVADVIDFTNAYNASGHIEAESTQASTPVTRDSGRHAILARLRNPFGQS